MDSCKILKTHFAHPVLIPPSGPGLRSAFAEAVIPAWVDRKEEIRNLMKYWRAAYTGQYSVVNRSLPSPPLPHSLSFSTLPPTTIPTPLDSTNANRYFTSCKRVSWVCVSIFFQCTRHKHEDKGKKGGLRKEEEKIYKGGPIFCEWVLRKN